MTQKKQLSPLGDIHQLTDIMLMVTPSLFGLNPETLVDNKFQSESITESEVTIRGKALNEFQAMIDQLRGEGIEIIVCPTNQDAPVATPDAVFPNNWISFHPGKIVLYPMKTPSRRAERQLARVQARIKQLGVNLAETVIDLTPLEDRNQYVEGTGSLVLDRRHGVGFASLSERTTPKALDIFTKETGYQIVRFHAQDKDGYPIYHTNIMMGVGKEFTVVGFEAIRDASEKKTVKDTLSDLGKEIIPISLEQLHHFCGNILQVKNKKGKEKIIMSQAAYDAFSDEQRKTLSRHGTLIVVPIPTIESIGGGSTRCMLAEVFESQAMLPAGYARHMMGVGRKQSY